MPRPVNRADPTLEPRTPARRRKVLWIVGAVVVASVAIEAAIVYPQRVTVAQERVDFRGAVQTMQQDAGGCAVALNDGYRALGAIVSKASNQLAEARTIIEQDEEYCTIAVNSDLYNLATYAPPNSLNHFNLTPVVKEVYAWAFPNAASVLAYMKTLLVHPTDMSTVTLIAGRLHTMDTVLATANAQLASVSRQLGISPQRVELSSTSGMPSFLRAELGRVAS
ncbi:hypothetical protein Afer_1715 [Acidimicrobium ferrooxidans DSM 10331]|uniref:DUF4012 domain-containing protein n=1 Tax=Acidimicrobium ferrooxidans (strain DSM 10331 / JCM 15462 / NBRC 103882 / ICP) TaxID=525909 RepID=C7M0X3_ACIFD|nr:hypothetical protein Afer_1715 [Acidimicrobium ferrooxidans DSM 10331]